jgi:hypothetical protein
MAPVRIENRSAASPGAAIIGLLGSIAFIVGGIAVIAAVVTLVFQPNPGAGTAGEVSVIGQSCIPNADGSVHVQGELRNDGGNDKIAIVEFSLTLFGGETETTQPFGGYNVPGGQTSLVGEDINVPPGASWVDCSVVIR